MRDTRHEVGDEFLDLAGEVFKELGSVLSIHDLPVRRPMLVLDEVVFMPNKRAVLA
jgi:hypothetical protein